MNIIKIKNDLYIGNVKIYGYIYKIENKINKKVYIGQSIRTFKERYRGDIEKNTSSIKLKRAINKYGIDNFDVSIVDYAFSKYELNIKEKTYISKYNSRKNGYNLTDGGEGSYGFEHNKKSKKIISIKSKKMWESKDFRAKHLEIVKARWDDVDFRAKISEPVIQLDSNFNFIQEHMGVTYAERETGIGNISFCCRGKYKSSGGYIWLYRNDYEYLLINNNLKNYRKYLCDKYGYKYANSNYIRVFQLDMDLNIVNVWEGVKIAEKELGISNITAVCKGRQKTSGGYMWCYETDYNDIKNNFNAEEARVYMAIKYNKVKFLPEASVKAWREKYGE